MAALVPVFTSFAWASGVLHRDRGALGPEALRNEVTAVSLAPLSFPRLIKGNYVLPWCSKSAP